ncbi:MAG: hypothetical protein HFJ50_02590, partial [Clostridia bacterium]|nr:hypothetical protein [Clostridia bacterium]
LTYTLSLNGQTRTATGTSGNYVTFSAVSGLSEYTTYSWTVTVKDTNNASTSKTGSDRTYCSGTTYSCTPTGGGTCSTCKGYGIVCLTDSSHRVDLRNFHSMSTAGHYKTNGRQCTVSSLQPTSGVEYYCMYCYSLGYPEQDVICAECGEVVHKQKTVPNGKCTNCPDCGGSGTRPAKCNHGSGFTSSHKYCDHNYNGVRH